MTIDEYNGNAIGNQSLSLCLSSSCHLCIGWELLALKNFNRQLPDVGRKRVVNYHYQSERQLHDQRLAWGDESSMEEGHGEFLVFLLAIATTGSKCTIEAR